MSICRDFDILTLGWTFDCPWRQLLFRPRNDTGCRWICIILLIADCHSTAMYSCTTARANILTHAIARATVLVTSGARTVILITITRIARIAIVCIWVTRLKSIFWTALSGWTYGRLGDAGGVILLDATGWVSIVWLLLGWVLVSTIASILIAIGLQNYSGARALRAYWHLVRSDWLAITLNDSLSSVLALLGQRALHAAPDERIVGTARSRSRSFRFCGALTISDHCLQWVSARRNCISNSTDNVL